MKCHSLHALTVRDFSAPITRRLLAACLVAIYLAGLTGCATHKIHASAPDLTGAIKTNQGIIESLTAAQQDDKEIKLAITALQASNVALHRLNASMTSNLDRADYKTSILLK